MDKIKNISLGGFSFLMEEAALKNLQDYLAQVRTYLSNNDDCDEILYDIELRMAELLKSQLKNKEVATALEVAYLMKVLGRPDQYIDEADEAQPQSPTQNTPRKLYRDLEGKKLGGVLSGVSYYFGWEVTLVRLLFIGVLWLNISLFSFGSLKGGISLSALLVGLYIIFWYVVPPARTNTEKLEMKRTAVTVSSLSNFKNTPPMRHTWMRSRTDRKIAGVFGGLAQYLQANSTWLRIGYLTVILLGFMLKAKIGILLCLLYALLSLVSEEPPIQENSTTHQQPSDAPHSTHANLGWILLKALAYFIAAIIALPLLLALVAVLMSLFGISLAGNLTIFYLTDLLPYLLPTLWQRSILFLAAILMSLFPISILLLVSLKLFTKDFKTPKGWIVANVLALVLGCLGFFAVAASTAREFVSTAQVQQRIPLPSNADTLKVCIQNKAFDINTINLLTDRIDIKGFNQFEGTFPTQETQPYLLITKKANGRSYTEARHNAQALQLPLLITDNQITIPESFTLKQGTVYRCQRAKIRLYLPKEKQVKEKTCP